MLLTQLEEQVEQDLQIVFQDHLYLMLVVEGEVMKLIQEQQVPEEQVVEEQEYMFVHQLQEHLQIQEQLIQAVEVEVLVEQLL
jgi:hypothetical protein